MQPSKDGRCPFDKAATVEHLDGRTSKGVGRPGLVHKEKVASPRRKE